MSSPNKIKIPFSWFGGKRRIASVVWSALGDVANYIEPFAGSLAVLLHSPKIPKIETINDLDCGLTNFWRAVARDAERVAFYAENPVNELDLHARHQWVLEKLNSDFFEKMNTDPDFFDAKIAGFWVYGQSISIGNNWLQPKGLKALPVLSSAGSGIKGLNYNILQDFKLLQERLNKVRVACGDWSRVVTPGITYNNVGISPKDITGVFLDPPYDHHIRDKVYREDKNIFKEVCDWAIKNGDNPKMRIVLCGYEGNHNIPDSWQSIEWKADGGFASLGNSRGKDNSKKERIWLSPFCNKVINE